MEFKHCDDDVRNDLAKCWKKHAEPFDEDKFLACNAKAAKKCEPGNVKLTAKGGSKKKSSGKSSGKKKKSKKTKKK